MRQNLYLKQVKFIENYKFCNESFGNGTVRWILSALLRHVKLWASIFRPNVTWQPSAAQSQKNNHPLNVPFFGIQLERDCDCTDFPLDTLMCNDRGKLIWFHDKVWRKPQGIEKSPGGFVALQSEFQKVVNKHGWFTSIWTNYQSDLKLKWTKLASDSLSVFAKVGFQWPIIAGVRGTGSNDLETWSYRATYFLIGSDVITSREKQSYRLQPKRPMDLGYEYLTLRKQFLN